MHDKLEPCLKDWKDLAEEYQELERKHKDYRNALETSIALQKKCLTGVIHQKYRLNVINKLMAEIEPTCEEEKGELDDLKKDVLRRKSQLEQMLEVLPRKSGRYLQVIMGNVDVSILDKNAKYVYKEQYESFKLIINLIGGLVALVNFFMNVRVLDLVFMFLIVWYYCTLTIRESILIVNGSRIKGWWRFHHFVSCAVGGVLLVWPDGPAYREFRDQHMLFFVYVAFLQYLQYVYQKGCLYRLRSLGERQDMDITIDGFHSWMWKGLGFLLPFLYIGYLLQLYNAYTLYNLSSHPNASWPVPCLSALFLLLGAGNIITTSLTIPMKWADVKSSSLKYKFVRLDKYFWNHRKRRISASQANPEYSEKVDRILRRPGPEDHDRILRRSGSDVRSSESGRTISMSEIKEKIEEGEESHSQTSEDDPSQDDVVRVEAVNRMSEIDTIKDVLNEDAAKDLHIKDVENKDGHAQDDMSENGEEKEMTEENAKPDTLKKTE